MAIVEKKIKRSRLTEDEVEELRANGIEVTDDPEGEVVIKFNEKQVITGADQISKAAASKLESPAKKPSEEDTVVLENKDSISSLKEQVEELKEKLQEANSECPRCNWPVGRAINQEPSEEEIAEFLKSACACEPYRREYSIYGGSAVVSFKTLSASESEAIHDYIKIEAASYMSQTVLTNETVMLMFEDMLFFSSIDFCKVGEKVFKAPPMGDLVNSVNNRVKAGESVDLLDEIKLTFKDMPFPILTAIKTRYREFAESVTILTSRSTDPKYWRDRRTSY